MRSGRPAWPAGSPWRPIWRVAAPDIKLAPEVEERGGPHVILTEFHESARLDRQQLFGRSARQGNPGSVEAIVSLGDELFQRCYTPTLVHLACLSCPVPKRPMRYCSKAWCAMHRARPKGRTGAACPIPFAATVSG